MSSMRPTDPSTHYWDLGLGFSVVPSNHIPAQNLYYNHSSQNGMYSVLLYLEEKVALNTIDPKPKTPKANTPRTTL